MMKRLFFKLLILLALTGGLSSIASAQLASVQGNLTDTTSNGVGTNTFVRFRLRNFSGSQPKIGSSSALAKTQIDMFPNPSGILSGSIEENSGIVPAGTYYTVEIWNNGVMTSSANYIIATNPWNLNTATPILTPPIPSGNVAFARTFVFFQTTASTSWLITHNFGAQNVVVQCADSNSKVLIPDTIVETDANNVTVTFTSPQTGSCIVMNAGNVTLTGQPANAVVVNPTADQNIVGFNLLHNGGKIPDIADPFTWTALQTFPAITVANAGIFNNSQMNEYAQSIINSCVPATYQQVGGPATDGMTACMIVPSASTMYQTDAFAAYNQSSSTTTNSVAGYFLNWGLVSGSKIWGINPNVAELNGVNPVTSQMISGEFDVNNETGINIVSGGQANPLNGIDIVSGGPNVANYGLYITGSGGFQLGERITGYRTYGIKLDSGGANTSALYITPPDNTTFAEVIGTNAAANLNIWYIDNNGTASFPFLSTTQLTVGAGASAINSIYRASGLSLNSPFTSITAGTCQEQTLTLTGIAATGVPSVSPTAALGTGFGWQAWISSANTITVRVCAGSTGTPNSVTWNASVID